MGPQTCQEMNKKLYIYLRVSTKGQVVDRFLGIGSPESTTAKDLEQFAISMFSSYGIDTGIYLI